MGYTNIVETELFLAQALTSARPNSTTSTIRLINIGNERDVNRISDDVVEFYISTADTQIDGILSHLYSVPLKKCVNGQWDLSADIDEYNSTIIQVSTSVNLVPSDEIVIRDDNTGIEESAVVSEIIDNSTFEITASLTNIFTSTETRVMRLQFPPPISQISARYAASYIYDKYFAAQNSPNISDYGKEMRKIAMGQLNDILNGKTILKCQKRVGDRFGNPWLDDTYAVRDRGFNTSERNMSDK